MAHEYIKDRPLNEWVRSQSFTVIGNSYIWNGFIRSLSWITCRIGCRMGNGLSIRLGTNPIAGLNAPYILPAGLKDYLVDFGISNLAQDLNLEGYSKGFNCWYSGDISQLGRCLG